MKKVLIVCANVFGHNGIANVILNYYKAMDKKKFNIDVLLINEPEEKIRKELEKNGSKVYVVERNTNPVKYLNEVTRIMKNNKYDLVHIHGNSATMAVELLAAKLAGIKVRIPHSHNTTSDHMRAHRLLQPLFNKLYTHGFACGVEAGKWLYGDKEFVVINNGIDVDKFQYKEEYRHEIRMKYDKEDKIIIGHVGVFNYQKNHEKLIEIFKKVYDKNPNYVLMLIGEGENKSNIEELVKTMGLEKNVIFVGTTTDIEKYMMAFDVLLLPSRFEGLPLVLVEAQCTGLHCIASTNVSEESNITGLVDFYDYEKDVDKYVSRILELQKNVNTREELARKAKDDICKKGYSIHDNARMIEELYQKYS